MNQNIISKLMNSLDYRSFLSLALNEESTERGYKKRVADSIGCQPAYLSQVLQKSVHLTPEQGEKLCHLWSLNDVESEYFFHLLLLGRAGTESLRERLTRKLTLLRNQWQKKEATYNQPSLQEMDRAFFYYSQWLHSAIHILLTIPQLQTSESLAAHLKIDLKEINKALNYLEKIGMVLKNENRWTVTQASIHSPEENLSTEMHHRNWRLQSIERGANKDNQSVRYTSIHTISNADFEKIRELLDQMIRNSRKIIAESPEEIGACMILDYFSLQA